MKNLMIILVGPSGAGKSSFLERALQDFAQLRDTTTYTTRTMRKGESEGHPYHFVSRQDFEERIGQNFFVEWAEVHGNLYGTPEWQINQTWEDGRVVIMDVDTQGAKTFKRKYPEAITVFIMPPSVEALRHRVEKRDGRKPHDLELRMQNAEREMKMAEEFDRILINDDFEKAYAGFKKIIEDLLGSS